jgi:hypothetical protein
MKTTYFKESLVNLVSNDDIKKRILEDPDFIKCFKYGNSLTKFLSRNTEELKDHTIAKLLMITEKELEELYQEAVDKLRTSMLESEDED